MLSQQTTRLPTPTAGTNKLPGIKVPPTSIPATATNTARNIFFNLERTADSPAIFKVSIIKQVGLAFKKHELAFTAENLDAVSIPGLVNAKLKVDAAGALHLLGSWPRDFSYDITTAGACYINKLYSKGKIKIEAESITATQPLEAAIIELTAAKSLKLPDVTATEQVNIQFAGKAADYCYGNITSDGTVAINHSNCALELVSPVEATSTVSLTGKQIINSTEITSDAGSINLTSTATDLAYAITNQGELNAEGKVIFNGVGLLQQGKLQANSDLVFNVANLNLQQAIACGGGIDCRLSGEFIQAVGACITVDKDFKLHVGRHLQINAPIEVNGKLTLIISGALFDNNSIQNADGYGTPALETRAALISHSPDGIKIITPMFVNRSEWRATHGGIMVKTRAEFKEYSYSQGGGDIACFGDLVIDTVALGFITGSIKVNGNFIINTPAAQELKLAIMVPCEVLGILCVSNIGNEGFNYAADAIKVNGTINLHFLHTASLAQSINTPGSIAVVVAPGDGNALQLAAPIQAGGIVNFTASAFIQNPVALIQAKVLKITADHIALASAEGEDAEPKIQAEQAYITANATIAYDLRALKIAQSYFWLPQATDIQWPDQYVGSLSYEVATPSGLTALTMPAFEMRGNFNLVVPQCQLKLVGNNAGNCVRVNVLGKCSIEAYSMELYWAGIFGRQKLNICLENYLQVGSINPATWAVTMAYLAAQDEVYVQAPAYMNWHGSEVSCLLGKLTVETAVLDHLAGKIWVGGDADFSKVGSFSHRLAYEQEAVNGGWETLGSHEGIGNIHGLQRRLINRVNAVRTVQAELYVGGTFIKPTAGNFTNIASLAFYNHEQGAYVEPQAIVSQDYYARQALCGHEKVRKCEWHGTSAKYYNAVVHAGQSVTNSDVTFDEHGKKLSCHGNVVVNGVLDATYDSLEVGLETSAPFAAQQFTPVVSLFTSSRPTLLFKRGALIHSGCVFIPAIPISFGAVAIDEVILTANGYLTNKNLKHLAKRQHQLQEIMQVVPAFIKATGGESGEELQGMSMLKIWYEIRQNTNRWYQENPELHGRQITNKDLANILKPVIIYVEIDIAENGNQATVLEAKLYLPAYLNNMRLLSGIGGWFARSIKLKGGATTITGYLDAKQDLTADVEYFALLQQACMLPNGDIHGQFGGEVVADSIELNTKSYQQIGGSVLGEDVRITAAKEIEVRALVERICQGDMENFDEIVKRAQLHAINVLQLISAGDVIFAGVQTKSGLTTEIQALANIFDLPAEVVKQRVERFQEHRNTHTVTDLQLAQQPSQHISNGQVTMAAGDSAILHAPEVTAPTLQISSERGTTELLAVTTEHRHTANITKKKHTGIGTKKSTSSALVQDMRANGAKLQVQQLMLAGFKGVAVHQLHSEATVNEFRSPNGQVAIFLGRNKFFAVSSNSKTDPFWQTGRSTLMERLMYSEAYIPGVIKIYARSIIVEAVRGRPLAWLPRLTNTAGISVQDALEYRWLTESYSREFNRVQGPGTGLVTLSAIAIAIATQGAASGLAASLLGTTTGAVAAGTVTSMMALAHSMITTGFISLAAQTGAAIMANRGDPKQAAKSLAGSNTVKSLVAAMVSAGVIHETCITLNLPVMADRRLMQHVQNNLAKASINAVVNMVAYDQSAEQAMLNIAVNTVNQTIIDAKTSAPGTSDMTRKVAHTTMGGISGAVIGPGALVGALEGLTVAIVPDLVGSSHEREPDIAGGEGDDRLFGSGDEDTLQDNQPGALMFSGANSGNGNGGRRFIRLAEDDVDWNESLDVGVAENMAISTGRSIVKFGQGVKQLYFQAGAKLGWSNQAEAMAYTNRINNETLLFSSTPAAQSYTGVVTEFVADMCIYSAIPAGTGLRGVRLVASSAAAGGFCGVLQPVYDGQLSTRFVNGGIGAVAGGIGGPLLGKVIDGANGGILRLFDAHKGRQFDEYVQKVSFADEGKLFEHFEKHGLVGFKGAYSNPAEYLSGAKDIMRNGYQITYVYTAPQFSINETRIGYVKFMGNTKRRSLNEVLQNMKKPGKLPEGTMKFEFVGTNKNRQITTYHVKNSEEFFTLINGSKNQKIITSLREPRL